METYKIITYGCQMNVHDSQKLEGMLKKRGMHEADRPNDADLVIFNTCCVREGAEDRAFSNIGALQKIKRSRPNMLLAVTGCMPQNKENREALEKRFPLVDIVFGTHNLHTLSDLIDRRRSEGSRIIDVWEKCDAPYEFDLIERGNTDRAFVNIMLGCDNFCSYCIVPYVRGRERSRNTENILTEIEDLAKGGKYKEIMLLGQNVNSYRGEVDFAQLLERAAQIEGSFTLTFMTSHPKDLSTKLIDVIARYDKIKKAVHLPMQSGSDRILQLMNRGYTSEHYRSIVNAIRAAIPSCTITSDIIVGFPSETDEDFEQTLTAVREIMFDNLYMFMYSPRAGTKAALMTEQIDEAIKKRRLQRLINVQRTLQRRK